MGTPGERKALLFLSAVMVLGGGVRVARAIDGRPDADPAAKAAIERQIEAVDSVRRHGKKKGKGRKPKKPEAIAPAIVDLDVATADQIETLRGIGPSLAKRIVADRDSLGPFGSLDELQRVKGVGPKLAARIDSSVTFSLFPRPSSTETSRSSGSGNGRRKPRRGKTAN
jgi:competence ComEA-like helix-hairpin-helix protein